MGPPMSGFFLKCFFLHAFERSKSSRFVWNRRCLTNSLTALSMASGETAFRQHSGSDSDSEVWADTLKTIPAIKFSCRGWGWTVNEEKPGENPEDHRNRMPWNEFDAINSENAQEKERQSKTNNIVVRAYNCKSKKKNQRVEAENREQLSSITTHLRNTVEISRCRGQYHHINHKIYASMVAASQWMAMHTRSRVTHTISVTKGESMWQPPFTAQHWPAPRIFSTAESWSSSGVSCQSVVATSSGQSQN